MLYEVITDDHQDRGDEEHPEQHLIVALEHRVEGEASEAGPGEHRLDQDRAADQLARLHPGYGEHRQDRVAEYVAGDDLPSYNFV